MSYRQKWCVMWGMAALEKSERVLNLFVKRVPEDAQHLKLPPPKT